MKRPVKSTKILRGKIRTRAHIIADMSANHFEWHALHCGYSVERAEHDYGVDLVLKTYSPRGEIENGWIDVQLKASERLKPMKSGEFIRFSVKKADLKHWLHEPMPVILVLYDADANASYWEYVQRYFAKQAGFNMRDRAKSATIHFSMTNKLDRAAIKEFAGFRDKVMKQVDGRIDHNA